MDVTFDAYGTVTLDPIASFLSSPLTIKVYKRSPVALDLWMFTQFYSFLIYKTIYLLNILTVPLSDVKYLF